MLINNIFFDKINNSDGSITYISKHNIVMVSTSFQLINNKMFETGTANGYIAIQKNHDLYEKNYDEVWVDVHGGLTYSGFMKNTPYKDYWFLGFDTCHYGDDKIKWSLENVCIEALFLKNEIEKSFGRLNNNLSRLEKLNKIISFPEFDETN